MITVFGSIGMDLLFGLPHLPAVGEMVLTPAYTTAMGGKGANQGVAAARDGGKVRFVGSVGMDGFGNEVRALLGAEGIDLAGLATVDAATCVAAVWFDRQSRNQIAVASGANPSTRADALRPETLDRMHSRVDDERSHEPTSSTVMQTLCALLFGRSALKGIASVRRP